MADWKQKARERAKERQEGESFKLGQGTNCFRILPNAKGVKFAPYVEIRMHREVGPEKRSCRCGKNIDGEGKCWLCDVMIPKLGESPSRQKQAMAEGLQSREQIVMQVSRYDPDTEKFSKPKLFWPSTGGGKSMGVQLLGLLGSSKRSYDDPKKGYNLNVSRTGTGMTDTRYGPLEPDEEPTVVPSSVLGLLKPFAELLPKYSENEQKALFHGTSRDAMADSDEEETDEDEAPKTKKGKAKGKVVEEEPEETEDEDEDEETEEETDEEEETEEDDETDDEEETEEEPEESDDDEETDDEEESEEVDEEEEEELDEESEEEEEEPEPPRKKGPVKKVVPPAKKAAAKKAPPPPAKKVVPKKSSRK